MLNWSTSSHLEGFLFRAVPVEAKVESEMKSDKVAPIFTFVLLYHLSSYLFAYFGMVHEYSVATHGHEPNGNEMEKGGNTHNDVKIKLHTFGISFLRS